MLHALRIKNFALINQIELVLKPGYTVITGETGSGKSILLHALNLILGERADFSVIGPESDKAVVEAEFEMKGFHLESFFQENDLDQEDRTIIRREINMNGKSRAFINDTPVSLAVLKTLTSALVNINSQYNTLELKNKAYQLEVLDTLSELQLKRADFAALFKRFNEQKSLLSSLKNSLSLALQQKDYTNFQLVELEGLLLDSVDYSSVETELKKIENGEGLILSFSSIIGAIEDENQLVDKLHSLRTILDRSKGLDKAVDELSIRLNAVLIELNDISSDASRALESVETNPEKLLELTESLNHFNHVLKKYSVRDQQEMLDLRNRLQKELFDTEATEHQINALEEVLKNLEKEITTKAKELHQDRLKAVQPVAAELQEILEELKLPNTKLSFQLTEREELNQFGLTDVNLLFSANVGIETVPIEKAASGGELSRVMLALQKMISEKKVLPTILFDEIDTGVSGDVAQKIGALLQKMGTHFQLLAISHLPQVAAKASHHFKVEKEIIGNRTETKVKSLEMEERIEEIARLMSGENITPAAMETAKSLMH
ncbi:MAG: repair protein RecN [Bacteroidota bacterium]